MSSAAAIRASVEAFHQSNGFGHTTADSFAPWYLHKRFKVAAQAAAGMAPGGNHDFGIDAFFLDRSGAAPTLYLIQAKYSESRSLIKKAVKEFSKLVHPLTHFIYGREFAVSQMNPVVHGLAAALSRFRAEDPTAVARLALHFVVIHLSEEEREAIDKDCSSAVGELRQVLANQFGESLADHDVDWSHDIPLHLASSRSMFDRQGEAQTIRFLGHQQPGSSDTVHLSGFGYLADLVDLYQTYREALFARNVRYFLSNKQEKGPAKYIRETLRRICAPVKAKAPGNPAEFAFYHNGITLHAAKAEIKGDLLELRSPNVINGCQTIKASYLFRHVEHSTGKAIDEAAWKGVVVPVRVIVTADENLLRQVTVGLNRQNQIRPSAFRANEPEQIDLQNRFAKAGVYYERQDHAFKNIRSATPHEIQDRFPNSAKTPIQMEELAQAIACAANSPAVSAISNVGALFEDPMYARIFESRRLESLPRLILLRNIFACSKAVARDLRSMNRKLEPLQPGKFSYVIARLCARYAIAYRLNEVRQFSVSVEQSFGPNHQLRKLMVKWCGPHHTKAISNIPIFWADEASEGWISPTDPGAVQKLLAYSAVGEVDVFSPEHAF